jgi:hypothetical protein
VSELALFAHRIIMRDPLDRWREAYTHWHMSFPKRAPPPALEDALRVSQEFAACVEAGFILFAPRRTDYWEGGGLDAYRARQSLVYVKAALGDTAAAPWHSRIDWSGWTGDPGAELDHDAELMSEMDSDNAYYYVSEVQQVQADSYARAARVALAKQTAAHFVPLDVVDDVFLRALIVEEAGPERDLLVATLLRDVRFPLLDGLKPRDAANIRASSEAFAAWREWLADLMLEAVSVEAATGLSAADHAAEKLRVAADKAREDISRSKVLSRYVLREAPVSISTVALAGAALGPKAAIGSGLGAAVRGAWSVLRPDAPAAPQGVLVRLLRE